jgi:hypothetical protein
MIGFGDQYKLFKVDRENEGLDTKNLSKNELYEIIAEEYLLPPVSSKSVTREYLLKVRNGEVFRITHNDYKNFEFTLNKSHSRKIGIINNALLVKKLNDLLEDREEPELGFTEYDLPEQNWLYKIARYIDKTNLLEFFESAPQAEPPLTDSSPLVSRIYYGRLYAGQWLFRLDKIKKNKKLYDSFQALSEKHKYLNSYKINCNVLQEELKDLNKKIVQLDTEMNDMAGKIAFTYTSLEDPRITPELVIAGGDKLTAEMRQCIMQNTQM